MLSPTKSEKTSCYLPRPFNLIG